jgi:hypothetical protein
MLAPFDQVFWIEIKSVWSQWKNSLVLVSPGTVVRWLRAGFGRYWRLAFSPPGWPKASQQGNTRTPYPNVDCHSFGGIQNVGKLTDTKAHHQCRRTNRWRLLVKVSEATDNGTRHSHHF